MSQPAEPVISVEVDITWDDVRAFLRRRAEPLAGPRGWLAKWLGDSAWSWRADLVVAGLFAIGMAYLLSLFPHLETLVVGTVVVGPLAIAGALLARTPWAKRSAIDKAEAEFRSGRHSLVGRKLVELDTTGVRRTDDLRREFWLWSVLEIEVVDDAVYLHFDRIRAVIVPRREFQSDSAFLAFGRFAKEAKESAVTGSVAPLPNDVVQTDPFDFTSADIQQAFLASETNWWPSGGAVGYALATALPVWGMCPLWNPEWQAWVAFPVGAGIQLYLLVGHKWKTRRQRRSRARRDFERSANNEMFDNVVVGVGPNGLTEVTRSSRVETRWSAVERYEISAEIAVFHEGTGMALVPRRVFATDDAYFDFLENAVEFRKKAIAG